MFRVFVLLLSLTLAVPALAATDYQCMNDCTNRGYMYQYCKSRCSYDTTPQWEQPLQQNPYNTPRIPQTDYQCLYDCTSKGYLYQFCKERCSY